MILELRFQNQNQQRKNRKMLPIKKVEDTGNEIINGLLARAYMMMPGVEVQLGEAAYNFGEHNCYMGNSTRVIGCGDREKIVCFNTGFRESNMGCCWELFNNHFENFTVESRVGLGQQSQTIGHHGANSKPNCNDTLRNMHCIGHSFCVYSWGNPNNILKIDACKIEAGRIGLLLMTGNGPLAQVCTVQDTVFNIDWEAFPGAGGDIGSRTVAIWIKAGTTIAFRNVIRIKSHKDCTLAASFASIAGNWPGSFPSDYAGFKWPILNGYENDSIVTPNGCTKWGDIVQDIGIVDINKKYNQGSGTNRDLVTI